MAGDVQLHAWRQREAAPEGAFDLRLFGGLPTPRRFAEVADLVECPPRFLHCLDTQDLLEVFRAVVIAAPNAERRRDQAFLDVVADRAARDAREPGEVADGVARRGVHGWTM